jgi:hypothetical protein
MCNRFRSRSQAPAWERKFDPSSAWASPDHIKICPEDQTCKAGALLKMQVPKQELGNQKKVLFFAALCALWAFARNIINFRVDSILVAPRGRRAANLGQFD